MTTRIVNCAECGGSGVRMGCTREIECFGCGGEGQWEVEGRRTVAKAATKTKAKKAPSRKASPAPKIEAIKGFNRDLTCRGFQFEIGKEYSVTGKISPCRNGFHACPVESVDPLRVFGFYAPGESRYCIVDQSGEIVPHDDDKAASSTIFIRREIGIGEIVDRAVKFRLDRAKATGETTNSGYYGAASNSGTRGAASNSGTRGAASNSGDYGAASNSGYYGAASNSGYYGAASNSGTRGAASNSGTRGAASNSGDYGAASNSGDYGAASNSGDYGAASNSGTRGAAFSHAFGGKVMCEGDGQALYITEFASDGSIKSVACGITGRDGIKAGVWYVCRDGRLVAA
jgi:hypothetical protein